ncbi:MAG: class I SAM-dependent methyltransferase family protein [Thermoleophilaceae bacterium]
MPPEAEAEAVLPTFADLQRDLPLKSPRAWRFGALALASRAGALVSDGLRVGYAHGFDSGPFMAHVYGNRAAGRTALGRRVDGRLLSRRTCVAFREIRELARQAVLDAIDAQGGEAPVIADLAAGPAPYLLEAIASRPGATAVVCDIDAAALAQAKAAARRLGVEDRVRTLRADAFDRDALRALEPRPDVVIELGLYGIYHDDRLIERHFEDLAELVAPRQIVLNVQTQNPEIEYIARVWRDHRGERCVWRLRSAERLLGWAAAAGYAPRTVAADSEGIYRVARLERA